MSESCLYPAVGRRIWSVAARERLLIDATDPHEQGQWKWVPYPGTGQWPLRPLPASLIDHACGLLSPNLVTLLTGTSDQPQRASFTHVYGVHVFDAITVDYLADCLEAAGFDVDATADYPEGTLALFVRCWYPLSEQLAKLRDQLRFNRSMLYRVWR